MKRSSVVILSIALALIFVCGGFAGGYTLARFGPGAAAGGTIVIPNLNAPKGVGAKVNEVDELLKDDALAPPDETSATAGAISGLLEATGDKYATYFDKKHFQYFSEESMGEFGGIGVLLGEKDGSAYVVEVYVDTPADNAKVKIGDEFREIDGVRRDKWTVEEVVKRVRGERGTLVKLTFFRPSKDGGDGQEYTVDVERDLIEYPNIESELKGDVGYIRLGQFNAKSTEEISAAVTKLEKDGARSLVLDLRDNPGGLLEQAIDASSLFIEDGSIVWVEERGKEPKEYRATGSAITKLPLVVLMNGNSASASEIVAGALQDYNRARLVGETSFGKGSVQTVEQLSFGGAVKYTIAHYLTPKKRTIDGRGLTPDVTVKMDVEKQRDEATDTQLKVALDEAERMAK